MSCLLTRPKKDSLALAKILTAMGTTCYISPMITIKHYQLNSASFMPEVVILTSKHALKYAHKFIDKKTSLLIVGQATAILAAKLGFINISTVQSDVGQLVNFILANISKSSAMLYLRAKDVSRDLIRELKEFNLKDLVVYQAKEAQKISPEILELLMKKKIHTICFFSPRSAEIFINLIKKHDTISFNPIKAFAISKNVAKIITQLSWHEIKIAKKPNQQAMIELFE
jgi:uroporphyrinogen-III synthase